MENKIKLWVFWYNSCVHESSSFPMSYHRTKKGAIEAMNKHKTQAKLENESLNARMKYRDEIDGFEHFPLKFGNHESWSVGKFELEILD